MNDEPRIGLVVPTLNAGAAWSLWLGSLARQSGVTVESLVIDSSSDDDTAKMARDAGHTVHVIDRSDFNHGATRQLGVDLLPDVDVIVFLTQDAILANEDALKNIVCAFEDPQVGAAYGRQLPHVNASAISSHARLFNYPAQSCKKSQSSARELGIKAAFISNSFAAYRKRALADVGGFPASTIMCEDVYVGAKILQKKWQIAYCADASVFHSHEYSAITEFKRYFDIGVFYAQEKWIMREFGSAGSEGRKYLRSEMSYLAKKDATVIPAALMRDAAKWLGFKLGLRIRLIPRSLRAAFSMHKGFWSHPVREY